MVIDNFKVEILYHLAELAHPGVKAVMFKDLERIDPERLKRVSFIQRVTHVKVAETKADRTIGVQVRQITCKLDRFADIAEAVTRPVFRHF